QILSVTCDNATSNDTMIDELEVKLKNFPGATNRTRCFAHIVNLIARSILRQFDLPKGQADAALEEAWASASKDIENEPVEGGDEQDDDIDDDMDGWVDERAGMLKVDRDALDASAVPVRLVLVKVRSWDLRQGKKDSPKRRMTSFESCHMLSRIPPQFSSQHGTHCSNS
ncbi:hypothetical protein BD779DRAFT_1464277, partial [Infundibulicybe gibba]